MYAVVPAQFISARDALVRQLRSTGDKAEAARVAKLRRPPPTAWALNQVARADPALIDELLAAGAGLRAATERALDGDASTLRQARAAERAAVDAIVTEAGRCLEAGGYPATDALRSRMAATLRAAIVEEPVAERLRPGMLTGDHDAPGFGMDALSVPTTAAQPDALSGANERAGADEQPEKQPEARHQQKAQEEARLEAERVAERLAAEAEALVGEADRMAGEADRMAVQAQQAREGADQARRRAGSAVRAAAAARAEADQLSPVTTTGPPVAEEKKA